MRLRFAPCIHLARLRRAFSSLCVVLLPDRRAEAATVPRKYAGIVVDAKSGKVLYESAADAPRYPASVTKVMTLYVLFQELAAGNITLSTKMTVSKHAASAVPTKLGLRPARRSRVEDAIKALVTISANDIARVIAEHISGQREQVRPAHDRDRQGAGHEAHDLPQRLGPARQRPGDHGARPGDPRHRDLPALPDLLRVLPDHALHATASAPTATTTACSASNGVDGIKTGYISASGYNLLTAARKDGRHIVVVGFGFDSAGSRDSKVRELVNKYLPKAARATISRPR